MHTHTKTPAKISYSEKLKNPKWQRRRLEVLQRDNFKCTLCGDEETELHIHHKKYTGEPHEAPLEDLQTLCAVCHKAISSFPRVDQGRFNKAHTALDYCYLQVDGTGFIAVNTGYSDVVIPIPQHVIELMYKDIPNKNG